MAGWVVRAEDRAFITAAGSRAISLIGRLAG